MSIRSSSPQPNERPIAAAHDDPFSALVHAAVNDRPVEEVANLITMLERSPQYANSTIEALRAIGTDRSVEDVTRLVALLTSPPRDAASADETIRAAVENRPVEEVTRLMALLHQTSKEHHCGEQAARAAASTRSVEDLVELIGRLSEDRAARVTPPEAWPQARLHSDEEWGPDRAVPPPPPLTLPSYGVGATLGRPARAPERPPERPPWPGLLVAAALFLCAVLWFPMYQSGEPVPVYVSGVAVSALYALLAVRVTLRPGPAALALAVVVPALLAAAELYRGWFHSSWLSQAFDLTLAPSWLAGLAAVCAALTALTALVLRVTAHPPAMTPPSRPLATASRPD
ncbi:hypothetical protein [Streptomyces sp. NPDC001401]|uniref:hypothetical protein n=1 Tax=Streptomyces sp. NPDC001401 TaxID=3364570 RepID=UPI0036CB063C